MGPYTELDQPEESLRPEKLREMYRQMTLIRAFEDRLYYMFLEGILPGTIHQYQGQEAVAVGVCAALEPGDLITSTHRPHGHAIAKGISLRELMAELFGKSTGCCRGKGGSMHVGAMSVGMLPAIPIVAAAVPIATGMALGFKMMRVPKVVACFFGEGATNNGAFHEGVNMAAIWDLPVIFICENNIYGASTPIHQVMKAPSVAARGSAYGTNGFLVDGNDVLAVYCSVRQAAAAARSGKGPTLIECQTYRLCGHSRSDPGHYRPKDELEQWKKRDPIPPFRDWLMQRGLWSDQAEQESRQSIEAQLDDAVKFARESPDPAPEDCLTGVYSDE